MYLHLGNDSVILNKRVIGIFDLDNSSYSKITRDFLTAAQREGRTESVSSDLPKAFVVTDDKIYLTQLGSQTLFRRAAEDDFI